MANIKDYIKKVMDGTVSLEEQQAALAQVEKTIVEAKQKRDEAVGQKADMVVQALKSIEAKLEAKLVELNNTPAKQGIQGPKGKDGKDGKDGLNGRDGVNGKDGKDGVDGIDGKDGISVVDAQVDFDGSLVIYLSNGSEIDAGKILSPEVAQQVIISGNGPVTAKEVTDTLADLQDQINTLTGIDGTLGTMAQQDDTSVDINGGAIDGTPIGATTPSTGSFTTLTAQTEVLKGTGQNLIQYSQTFANWTAQTGVSATDNTTVAPNGTTTAATISWTSAAAGVGIYRQTAGQWTGITNTKSIYIKADVAGGTVQLTDPGTTVGTTTVTLTTDWQRVSLTDVGQTTYAGVWVKKTASSPNTIYLWGGQLELGSVVNTYVPTTTTVVYGTPSLSFSGVAGIGLESNGSLYHQPAGTGAVQAQATTSTATGGNVRGANAVDWQTARDNSFRVASGQSSAVGGGYGNTASQYTSTVSGGYLNTSSSTGTIVAGGSTNTASSPYSAITGGELNTAAGYFNFIGGGFTNSGTSGSAVTTQATTTVTSGSTAVTLSGSNASIKVGQYITGTGIATETYVAAISGTSLTLSKNASGSGTPTLSFYTPHGVVVGGGNNQATGSYSFIGGGGDAGTAANRNVASGDWSVVAGGVGNQATGFGAYVGGGGSTGSTVISNIASGTTSSILGGVGNTNSGQAGFIGAGFQNTVNSNYGGILAGRYATTRSIIGNHIFSACNSPISGSAGISQSGLLVLGRQTTDATATVLASDTNAASTTNQVILPNNSAYYFRGEIVAGVTGGGNTKGWFIEGVIKRGANAASTAMVGTATVTSNYADAGAATWTVAVAADTTNGGLKITVTGQAATTIRWVAQVRTTECTY